MKKMSQEASPKTDNKGSEITNCFVVMPFGHKPFRDGSARMYDFDKVYRIIIQRAIRQAGMQPIRADETIGSSIIHGAMFKDLRDQPVVLADLSLDNPNVFYELGIRHVMSSSGTVLICEEGSTLPFDVNLSRVIFYKYDGQSLDWEEVERMVEKLQVALQQARRGEPDSPIHALLETVFRVENQPSSNTQTSTIEELYSQADLIQYQKKLAEIWKEPEHQKPIKELYKEHQNTIFGVRALGYYCLEQEDLTKEINRIASDLATVEQYTLAVKIYEKLNRAEKLNYHDLLKYASALSERDLNLSGAERAIELVGEAQEMVKKDSLSGKQIPEGEAMCERSLAGLWQWKWQLTKSAADLKTTILQTNTALKKMEDARAVGAFEQPGQMAIAHLRIMILLRIQDNNIDRPDTEGHRDAILSLKAQENEKSRSKSYLNWYQAITLADSGADEPARRKAMVTYGEDAKIMNEPGNEDIGRKQYVQIRRFIEQYSQLLRNPSIIGSISQILQFGHANSIKMH